MRVTRHHRDRLARAVHPQPADPPRRRSSRRQPTSPSSTCPASPPIRRATARRTDTVIALDMSRKLVLIAGTAYAGEIKKIGVLAVQLPRPAARTCCRCTARPISASDGDAALFFGLSGTGKTTLSQRSGPPADRRRRARLERRRRLQPRRRLLRQDHQAQPQGGARDLRRDQRFGTVLENVVLDDAPVPLYDDISLTENTRAAYPLETLPAVAKGSVGGTPKTVVFLTADAFGVLPPIARLTPEQAVYHFLSGYTAKVAGTERGVTEPQATFSACFGAPFMPLHPTVYGELLDRAARRRAAPRPGCSTPAGPAAAMASASASTSPRPAACSTRRCPANSSRPRCGSSRCSACRCRFASTA